MREIAAEERAALGVGPRDYFDPYALCAEHGIAVYTLADLQEAGLPVEAAQHFTGIRAPRWSAALVPLGEARVIIENETHARVRRRSSIAHELGHHLLEHPFQGVVLGEDHHRQFDPKVEKEATFLAGELLVPHAAAERAAFDGWTNADVAKAFGVSEQFAQMQMYGQRVRAGRAAARYARTR